MRLKARLPSMPAQVVGRVDDDRVEAGLLGVDELAVRGRRLLEPGAEGRAAGVVDDRDLVALGEGLGETLPVGLGRELHEGRVEAGLREHRPRATSTEIASGSTARGCGLTTTGVAGDERGEDAGVGVPRREGVAADDERDAARHDAVVLLHPQSARACPRGHGPASPRRPTRARAPARRARPRPPRSRGPARAAHRPGTT